MLRDAVLADIPAVCEIYNEAISEGGYANVEAGPVTLATRLKWFRQRGPREPTLVWDSAREGVVAWGALGRFGARPQLQQIAELSIYVTAAYRNRAVGGRLLVRLLERAHQLGYRLVVAVILSGNVGSARGVARFGFRRVAVLPRVAKVRGEYVDIDWYCRSVVDIHDLRADVAEDPRVSAITAGDSAAKEQSPHVV